jgi:hypothetical protein
MEEHQQPSTSARAAKFALVVLYHVIRVYALVLVIISFTFSSLGIRYDHHSNAQKKYA